MNTLQKSGHRGHSMGRQIKVVLAFLSLTLMLASYYKTLQANQVRQPYEIAQVKRTALLTIIHVQLHTAASLPELKAWGDEIKQNKSPRKAVMVHFYDGAQSEETYLGNYQDGIVYLARLPDVQAAP